MALPDDWVIERVDEGSIGIPAHNFQRQLVRLIPISAVNLPNKRSESGMCAHVCVGVCGHADTWCVRACVRLLLLALGNIFGTGEMCHLHTCPEIGEFRHYDVFCGFR